MFIHDFLNTSASRHGGKPVLIHGREKVTYSTLAAYSCATAGWLSAQRIKTGERVAILTDNPVHYLAVYFGILQAGGIVVGLNTLTSERALDSVLRDCRPSFLFISGRSNTYRKYIESHHTKVKIEDIDSLLALTGTDLPPRPAISPKSVAQIIYTSGTMGQPKGVMLSHRNLTTNTSSIIQYMNLTENERVMAVLPFFYSYGNSVMLTHIAVGGSLVVNQSFVYPNMVLDQMIREEVTGFSGVPSVFALLLHRSAVKEYSFPRLRYLSQAGAAMSPALAGKLQKVFPHSDIYIMYGQTEAGPRLSYLAPEYVSKKPGSIGKAIPGVSLEILRKDATPAAVGEVGEIVAAGENIMVGYWQRPRETREVLRRGKLWTGDLAYSDEEGFIYIVSRKSDMIKCGSHRIAPKEIEDILEEVDGILESAVIGVEDKILGQKIHAYVVLQPGCFLTRKEIISYCAKNLPSYKIPHAVTFLDKMPKSGSGKIRKDYL